MDAIAKIISALSIPLTIVLIWLLFGKRLLLSKFPGIELSFDKPKNDAIRNLDVVKRIEQNLEAEWHKTGNIYWLAHDLALAMCIVTYGDSKFSLISQLELSLHHIREIQLKDKIPEQKIVDILEFAKTAPELSRGDRRKIAGQIDGVLDEIGAYMAAHQPGYRGGI